MKTIITSLPIYNTTAKQTFTRGIKGGIDVPKWVALCPNDELPSFQFIDDDASSVSSVETINFDGVVTPLAMTIEKVVLSSATYFIYYGGAATLDCGAQYLRITMDNASVYYSEWFNAQDTAEDGIMFEFYNDCCDLGNIYYATDFTQKVWIASEFMEPSFPTDEEGATNGQGRFVRTFARQVKKYTIKALAMPDYMVDVFNRARLHDSIFITFLGETNEVFNLEVEHEYMADNNYYVLITLTFDFDEAFVIGGCCNAII